MRRISKWLYPSFLQRLDHYLLDHHPVIWRTRFHIVLFYAAIASLLLYLAGRFFPVDIKQPNVDPIAPIELTRESYYYVFITITGLILIYWVIRMRRYQEVAFEVKKNSLLIAIHLFVVYFFITTFATSFRMGNIAQHCYLLPKADLDTLLVNHCYAYGFLWNEKDTVRGLSSRNYYKKRQDQFRKIVAKENSILLKRYEEPDSRMLRQSKLRDLSNRLNRLYQSFQDYQTYRTYRLYRPYWSYWSNRSDLSDWAYCSNRSNLSDLSYLSYRSDRSYLSFSSFSMDSTNDSYRSYLIDLLDRSDSLYQVYTNHSFDYYNYYVKGNPIKQKFVEQYQLKLINENSPDDILMYPSAAYEIEDIVRCLRHSRQFFDQRIWLRYWEGALRHLILITFMFFISAFVRLDWLIIVFGCFLGGLLIIPYILDAVDEETFFIIHGVYTLPIIICLLYFIFTAAFKKKNSQLTKWAIHVFFVTVGLTLYYAIYGGLGSFPAPSEEAFYVVQALCLIGMYLIPYVRSLPREV